MDDPGGYDDTKTASLCSVRAATGSSTGDVDDMMY